MRGLDTRVLLANARIMQLLDAQKASSLMVVVGKQAEKDGLLDAANGIHTMPVMFDDELVLASRWCAGQARHTNGLDKAAWRKLSEQLAADAGNGCGLSYDYYVSRLSRNVDWEMRDLTDAERVDALVIACEFGYETVEAREQTQIELREDGYCTHGIEMGCCPAGCDFPDNDVFFDNSDYDYDYYGEEAEEYAMDQEELQQIQNDADTMVKNNTDVPATEDRRWKAQLRGLAEVTAALKRVMFRH